MNNQMWFHQRFKYEIGQIASTFLAVTSSTLQSQLMIKSDQCPNYHLHCSTSGQISSLVISLIKSLKSVGLPEYFVVHIWHPNLKPKSFTCPFAVHTELLAGAGAGSESRQLILMAASWVKLVKLTCHSWIPQQDTSASAQPYRHWQGCCQEAVNKPAASVLAWFGSMSGLVPDSSLNGWQANLLGRAGEQ
jgi:hypothetical protein